MKDQIIEISGQYPFFAQAGDQSQKTIAPSYPSSEFWLHVYTPLTDWKALPNSRMLCPWSLAAELDDTTTPVARRHNIIESLKRGLKMIRQYGLPAARIFFAEDCATRQISVYVD